MAEDGAQQGNPDDGTGGGGQGQTTNAEVFAELDEATREWLKTRHENDPLKVAKQAYELDKWAGKAVAVPGDDAEAEDWEKFYSKIGRPEAADKYEFAPPEKMPETVPYNEDLAKSFKDEAFNVGLTAKQAAEMHDWFVTQMAEAGTTMQNNMAEDLGKTIDDANAALKAAWGDPNGETYKANLELAGKFFDAIDEKGTLGEVLAKRSLLGPDREVLVPELAFAFAKAGAALFTEGGSLGQGGSGPSLESNPFDPEKTNLTEAMKIVGEDRDKARVLAKAAGADLSLFGL